MTRWILTLLALLSAAGAIAQAPRDPRLLRPIRVRENR